MNRRHFLCHAGAAALSGALAVRRAPAPGASTVRLRTILVAADHAAPTMAGVLLALDEARRTAALVGGSVEWERIPPRDIAATGLAGAVIISAVDASECAAIAARAAEARCLHVDAATAADALRGRGATTVHVSPSDAMRRHAVESWSARAGVFVDGGRGAAWHPALDRFGAAQLNERLRRAGLVPDEGAWLGWMAGKLAWEAAVRAGGDVERMADVARGPRFRIDGHKGWPLTVRRDGQLSQPLYVLDGEGGLLGEIPERMPADAAAARAALDAIGTTVAPR